VKNGKKCKNNSGSALMYVIMASVIIILVESALFLIVSKEKYIAADLLNSARAFYLADSGANYVLYQQKIGSAVNTALKEVSSQGIFEGTFKITNLGGNKYSSEGKSWNAQNFSQVLTPAPGVHYTAKRTVYFEIDPAKNIIIKWREER